MPIANEQTVSVEFATDEQFQTWIASCGIPVDDNGFAEWSFDDRCGVIMYALSCGLPLQFADTKNSETIPKNLEKEHSMEEQTAIEKIDRTVELLRSNPNASDEDIRSLLELRTSGTARMYKIKARDIIENGAQEEGA